MKKHVLRKLLSSIFSSDDDGTQLIQVKEEMENKVEKILELINAQEKVDQSDDGPELVFLVENFYKDYQELYGRYDNLVGKLKKSVHKGKEMNGDASGSDSLSDSDSSDSDGGKKKKNGKIKIHKVEFEEMKASFHRCEALQKELDDLKVENKGLETEVTSMLGKLQEAKKIYCELMEKKTVVEELENELSSVKESRRVVEVDNERLKLELEISIKQKEEVNERRKGIHKENEALVAEKFSALQKLLDEEKSVEVLKIECNKLKHDITRLKDENVNLKEDLERESKLVVDLRKELEVSINEKDAVCLENSISLKKLSEAEKSVEVLKVEDDNLKDVISKLHNESKVFERKLESTSKRVSSLQEQLDIANEENNALSLDKSTVLRKIGKAEKEIEELKNEVGANLELANRRSSENAQLLVEIDSLSQKLQVSENMRDDLSKELSVTKEESCNFNIEISKIQKQIEDSAKVIEDLKCELASKIELIDWKSSENAALLMDITSLKLKLETTDKEKSDLHIELNVAKEESFYLSSEISRIQKQIDETQKIVENLKNEASTNLKFADERSLEKSQLLLEIQNLNHKLEADVKERSELKKEITAAEERISDLNSEISKLSKHIEEEEKLIENLNSESEANLELANKRLSENAQLLLEIESLKLNSEAADRERSNLNKDLTTAKEENLKLSSKISVISLQIDEASKTIEMLKAECGELKANEFKLLSENKHLDHELRMSRDEVRHLSKKYTEIVDEIRLVREVGDELSAKVEMLNKEKIRLLNDHGAFKMEVEASHGKIAELEKRLEQSQREKDALVVNNNILISEKSSLLTRLDETLKSKDEVKAENDFLNNETIELNSKNASLKREFEETVRQVSDLKMQLNVLCEEKDAHSLEKVALLNRLEQVQKDVENLKNEASENLILVTKKSAEIAQLIHEKDHLGSKMVEAEKMKATLVKELASVKEETESLKSEKLSSRLQMEEIEKTIKELRSCCDLSKDDNSKLVAINTELTVKIKSKEAEMVALSLNHTEKINKIQQLEEYAAEQLKISNDEKARLLAECECLKSERESADLKITDLVRMLEGMQEEKRFLSSENEQFLNRIDQLEKMMNDLQSDMEHQKLESERRLLLKTDEVVILGKKLEEVQIGASNNVNTFTAHVNNLRSELDMMYSQNTELKEQVLALSKNLSEINILKEKMESELRQNISEQAARLDENQNKYNDLMSDYQIVEDQFRQSCIKLDTVENMIEELEATIKHKDMEKVNAEKEKEKLHEQIETLEVHLRLVNQKLKITETENRAKEENNKTRMNELLENKSGLQEQIELLYRKASHLEMQTKKVLAIELDRVYDVVHNIELTFEKKHAEFHVKLVKFFEELQTMKGTTRAMVSKMQELENEKSTLISTVEQNNASLSRLKEEAAILQMKLVEETKEEERLKEKTLQYQSMLTELQKTLEMKEEEGRFKDEEKREAIRQLCYQIEYHREKWDNMFHLFSAKVKNSQQ